MSNATGSCYSNPLLYYEDRFFFPTRSLFKIGRLRETGRLVSLLEGQEPF